MDVMESTVSVEESIALVKARINKRQLLKPAVGRVKRQAVAAVMSNPTKELDAVVLADTLVGYGANISLENMAIIENLIKFAKLEASFEVPSGNPKDWYLAFLKCMDDAGCLVADSGYTSYQKSSHQLTMDNIVTDIVKAGVDAAKAALPGAAFLGAIADSALGALKKEPEAIKLFNSEVIKKKGVRLAVMPCDQLANGIILTSLTSIDCIDDSNKKEPLFFDWKTSNVDIFRGNAYMTFNPLRYAVLKDDLEEYLGQYYKAALSKRFQRRKNAIS
ncbi:hypothetical protein [Pseudomonas arsenicoxydans]|uniref:Uncharacterized protein n=1 Tax=Pseudomonas arsenicoxydans TaxID=702115 RepID=A0A4P6FVL7_9PSED|nr:hypothetical protein [Pseudomonas arsenicoxydans]QAY82749.1 hypothetical protein CUN61_01680 [Pseudomonas arsenicoxydans]